MLKVLVIGGGGYIGANVSRHLVRQGFEVIVLDSLVYKNNEGIKAIVGEPGINYVFGDMANKKLITNLCEEVDSVVLLAGLVGDPITKKYPNQSRVINDLSLKSCIDSLIPTRIKQLIFISTCSNYGLIKDDELADETSALNPLSLYAKSKVSAERYILSLESKVGFDATILRFATAFGVSPRMRFDLTVNEFVHKLARNEELVVFDPDTWRPYCHVNDFAKLILMVLLADKDKTKFQIFNAGGDTNNATKRKLVNKIVEFIPNSKIIYQEKGSDPRNYRVNFSKVKNILGFEPSWSIEDGIKEILNFTNSNLWIDFETHNDKYGNYILSQHID